MKNSSRKSFGAKPNIVVLGAGVTGMTAAYRLAEKGHSADVIEHKNYCGGLSTSFRRKGCIIDYGPHKIYTQLDDVLSEIRGLLGRDLITMPKKITIFVGGKYLKYPFGILDVFVKLGPVTCFRLGLSFVSTALKNAVKGKKDGSYESYIVNRFGKFAYNLSFRDLAGKFWGDPKKLSPKLAEKRIPVAGLGAILKQKLSASGDETVCASDFFYPRYGMAELIGRIGSRVTKYRGRIHLNSKPTSIRVENGKITSVSFAERGKKKAVERPYVVSTLPLKTILSLISPKPPQSVLSAAAKLKNRSLVLAFFTVNRERITDSTWIYFPEKKFFFNRVSEQKAFSKYTVPKGKTLICAEIACATGDSTWKAGDSQIAQKVGQGMELSGLCKTKEMKDFFTVRIPDIYPVYDLEYDKNLNTVLDYLDKIRNFITIGRLGLFNYNNMDLCMEMAFEAADFVAENKRKASWIAVRNKFDEYKIVD